MHRFLNRGFARLAQIRKQRIEGTAVAAPALTAYSIGFKVFSYQNTISESNGWQKRLVCPWRWSAAAEPVC
jgi:hypothetical protein